MFFIT